tara:strand:+ start:38 stop:547 length:510 start_codon:yes stop_codon:yes gene_type:complete
MANFKDSTSFTDNDEFYTPEWVWNYLKPLIPKTKVIWEACMLGAKESTSMKTWKDWGYEVKGDTTWDILDCDIPECDMIITNPPFSTGIKMKVLERLMVIDKPFAIILNGLNIHSKYFQKILNLEDIQVIHPSVKFHYQKSGAKEEKKTSFYSVFVCYKMNLPNQQLFC